MKFVLHVRHSLEIRRPAPDVFAYVSDLRHWPEWATGVLALEEERDQREGGAAGSQIADSGPNGAVGQTYRYVRRVFGRTVTGTIRVVDRQPERGLTLQGTSAGAPWTSHVTVDAVPGGARLTEVISQDLPGTPRLLEPVIAYLIRRVLRADHAGARRLLER